MQKHEPTFLAPHNGLGTPLEGFKQKHQYIKVHWHDSGMTQQYRYQLLDLHRLLKNATSPSSKLQAAYDCFPKQRVTTQSQQAHPSLPFKKLNVVT